MVNATAFCDESGTDDVFNIAGFVAPATEWERLDTTWVTALEEEGLTEFKMSDCEQRRNAFKGWSRERADRVQARFISLINAVKLGGICTGVDIRAYGDVLPTMKVKRAEGYSSPYLLAFQHQLELMALQLEHLPGGERIRFVFDEQREFQGRANRVFHSVKRSSSLTFVSRLGEIAFSDSKKHPGLQAADILAYESRRQLADQVYGISQRPERWQWQSLVAKGLVIAKHFGADQIRTLVELPQASASGR